MLVDHQALFREGLSLLLQGIAAEVQVAEAGTLAEALELAERGRGFDAVLIELLTPGMNGSEGIRALRSRLPNTPIVVISADSTAQQVRDAIEHGAMGYIPKETDRKVMLNALRLVLDGGIYVPPSVLQRDPVPPRRRTAAPAGRPAFGKLTPRQSDVLVLLAQGRSNRQIALALGMAEGTVRIHVTAILRAFGAANRTEAALAAARLMPQPGATAAANKS